MARGSYLLPGRLEDVVLLIQYLAPDDRGQVYDETIRKELGVGPSSPGVTSWAEVARQHPEFFRVSGDTANKAISLLAKFAMRKSESGQAPHELLAALIEVAMKLEERQAKAAERRHVYLPLITALIAGAFTLVATMLPRWLGH
jgi:hypothetical protein